MAVAWNEHCVWQCVKVASLALAHTCLRTLSHSIEISTLGTLVESISGLVHGQTEGIMAVLSPLHPYPFSGAAYQTCSTPGLTQCNERNLTLMVKFPTGKWKGPAPLSWSQFLGAWLEFLNTASWFSCTLSELVGPGRGPCPQPDTPLPLVNPASGFWGAHVLSV